MSEASANSVVPFADMSKTSVTNTTQTDTMNRGHTQFTTPIFSFGASSSAAHPVSGTGRDTCDGTTSLLFLDGLDSSLSGGAHALSTLDASAPVKEASAMGGGLEDVFTKFSAGPNAEGSSGFLSESSGTPATNAVPPAARSTMASPLQTMLPVSPSSCASSQPHTFPSMTPSPSVQGFLSTPNGVSHPLGTHSATLSPNVTELSVPVTMSIPTGYAMNNMFVPLLMPNGGAAAPAVTTNLPANGPTAAYMGIYADAQTAGRRVENPMPVAALPPPASAANNLVRRNVYVSGLPSHFRSNDLRELCQPFGRIEASKLCVDTTTNPTKGYGFALFFDESSAAACIVGLNGRQVCGRTLQARYADVAATPKPAGPNALSGNASTAAARHGGRTTSAASAAHNSIRRPQAPSQQPPTNSAQSSSPASAPSLSPPLVSSPFMYAAQPKSATPMASNLMWVPSQMPAAQAAPHAGSPYVMMSQPSMPLMPHTGVPITQAQPAPLTSAGFFYVMDPNTNQVQLCQCPTYPTYVTGSGLGGGAPVQFTPQ